MTSVCSARPPLASPLLLTAAYKRAEPSSVMADAANAFLNSLWPDQKAKVSYAFDDDERLAGTLVPTGVNYKPGDCELRKGTPLGAMQPFQRELATALLVAGLSQQGVIKAQSIMSLEQVLLLLEAAKPANRRDPDNYFITIRDAFRQRHVGLLHRGPSPGAELHNR